MSSSSTSTSAQSSNNSHSPPTVETRHLALEEVADLYKKDIANLKFKIEQRHISEIIESQTKGY